MNKLSVDQVNLVGKRVLVRVDFNVPLKEGVVTDDTRIKAAIPTLRLALNCGAKVIVASHLGRPKGEVKPEFSLRQIIPTLEKELGSKVTFSEDCIGQKAKDAVDALKRGELLLLENLRFHKGETTNDPEFAAQLAELADAYVNDAFGTAHRAHASTEGVAKLLKPSVAGFLLRDEIGYFNRSLAKPEKPLAVVIGGAKVSSKLDALSNLIETCDIMVVGGGMAFTFLKAMGYEVGGNILEEDMIEKVKQVMARAKERGVKFYLPVDLVIADSIDSPSASDVITTQEIPKNCVAPDIGPATIALFKLALKSAKTIVWNGPMGVFENKAFAVGTFAIAHAIASSDALSVVGGGDSVAAIKNAGLDGEVDHISTGGGAFLELLEGKKLPGIEALTDKGGVTA